MYLDPRLNYFSIWREDYVSRRERRAEYRKATVTPASWRRLLNVMIGLGGDLIGDDYDEDTEIPVYVHEPAGCIAVRRMDALYGDLPDTDWCARRYAYRPRMAVEPIAYAA
jgi:hypothetical protein